MNSNNEKKIKLYTCAKCTNNTDLQVCFHCSIEPLFLCTEHDSELHKNSFRTHKRINLKIYLFYHRALFLNNTDVKININKINTGTGESNNEKNILVLTNNFQYYPGKKVFNIVNNYNSRDILNIVSFFSENESGKSFLVRSLIPTESELPNLQTKTNHLYAYDDVTNKTIYLDFPNLNRLVTQPLCQKLYLELLYLFSDVICYPIITSLEDLEKNMKNFKKITEQTKISRSDYSPINPSLIVILNHKTKYEYCEDYDLAIDNFLIIHQTTELIKKNFLSLNMLTLLSGLFSDIWFINIYRLVNNECILIKQLQRLSNFIQYLISTTTLYKNEHQQIRNLFPDMFDFIGRHNNNNWLDDKTNH
jgi:hypothetical protein